MEEDGGGLGLATSPPSDHELSPPGSPPQILDLPQETSEVVDDHLSPSSTAVLSDDLRGKIIKQVEYYFSDENLPTDKFLMKYVNKDKEGFVPIFIIASFAKMKKIVQDRSLITAALRESSLLVVSLSGKKVRRVVPLPHNPKLCTIFVENLPQDHSKENIQRIFSGAGNVKSVVIRNPTAVNESTKGNKAGKLICDKVHALVEYETVECAEKAVTTLNDEKDWRNGLRVQLLSKRVVVGKNGPRRKCWKVPDSEKNSNARSSIPTGDESHTSSELNDEAPEQQDENHLLKESHGPRGRGRGRSWGQKFHGHIGHGQGSVPSISTTEVSKPPPGPKMPDGTRGFTMGRGRPLVLN